MAAANGKPADFQAIWTSALKDFYRSTGVDLEDPTVYHPKDVDDLIGHLRREHTEFGSDTRSSKFTNVIKSAVGPVNFLTATAGSSAAQMFPGGSQVLAAFGILVNAGAAVTHSFDAVGGLFAKLGNFTGRLKEVSSESIPDALVPIYQAILVSLLNVCALAVRMSFRDLKEEKPEHGRMMRKLRKLARPVFANIDEYIKNLMGGNSEVSAAVGTLETLVENESLMMQAIILRKTTRIESIAVDIQGLTVQWTKAAYDMQADTSEVKLRVTLIGQSLERIEASQKETRDNTSDIKAMTLDARKAQSQHSTALEAIDRKITAFMEKGGAGKQHEASEKSKAAVSSESKLWKKLEANLGVKSLRVTNSATYERLAKERLHGTAEWILKDAAIQQLLSGENGFLVVSGDAGHGKTFLASRIIDHISDLCKPGTHGSEKSMAYFFCRKGQTEEQYVSLALKTMAYEIARTDKLYAKHLTDLADSGKLSQNDGVTPAAAQKELSQDLSVTATSSSVDEPGTATAPVSGVGTGATEDIAPTDVAANVDSSEDPILTQKLHRVNTAVLERQALPDEEEENTVRPIQRHWEHLFGKYFTGATRHVFIVLDGLDECNETEAVALCAAINASFSAADRKPSINIHLILLMTTRRAKVFTPKLLSAATVLQVHSAMNSSDLNIFVGQRLNRGWQNKVVQPKLRNEARKAVLEGCDGNFLHASLLVDEIVSLSREDVIRTFLRNLPTTVESAMLLVINRLSRQLGEHDLKDLHDILAWVACARRDLKLAELDAMLSTRRGSARVVDLETRLRDSFATLFLVNGQVTVEHSVADERVRRRLEAIGSASVAFSQPAEGKSAGPVNTTTGIDDDDEDDDVALRRATANMQKISVTLSHTLIAEQIQKRTAQAGITDFTTDSMHGAVLFQCLEILCDVNGPFDEQTSRLSGRYSGLYLSDHILALEPIEVEPGVRSEIAKLIVKLLREPSCSAHWVNFAAGWLAEDLAKPAFHERIVQWLKDPDVQAGLDALEVQWINDAMKSPFASLFAGVAHAVALRWLTQVIGDDEDCVRFLLIYQDALETSRTEHPQPDRKGIELSSLSTEEVLKIAEWAALEKNGRWYSRIGRLLRGFERNDESLEMFKKAVELDSKDANIRGGMGATFAAQNNFDDAAKEASASVELFIEDIERGVPSPDPGHTMAYALMTTRQELATYYVSLERIDDARQVYEAIMTDFETFDTTTEDWNELLSIIFGYYCTLTNSKRWEDCATLLQRLLSHPQRLSENFAIYWWIAFNEVMLLQIGYHRKDLHVLLAFNDHALANIARYENESQVPPLIFARAMLLLRLSQDRTDEAIRLLGLVTQDDEVDDWTKDRADREVARHYLNQTLQAREKDRWTDVGRYAESLVKLATDEKDVDGSPVFRTRECSLVLAAWDHMNGRMARARKCVLPRVTLGIDMLSDTDPDNDILSWMYLSDAFLAIGDKRAIAVTNMLRQSLFAEPVPSSDRDSGSDSERLAKEASEGDAQAGASREPVGAAPSETESNDSANRASSSQTGLQTTDDAATGVLPETSSGPNGSSDSHDVEEAQEIAAEAQSSSEDAKPNPSGTFYMCDGCCFEDIANNALMWRCSFCIADFCDNCHKLIMGDKMEGWNICGDTHDHVEILGVLAKYPKNMIKIDGEDVLVADFVATLREEWDYPVKEGATAS